MKFPINEFSTSNSPNLRVITTTVRIETKNFRLKKKMKRITETYFPIYHIIHRLSTKLYQNDVKKSEKEKKKYVKERNETPNI